MYINVIKKYLSLYILIIYSILVQGCLILTMVWYNLAISALIDILSHWCLNLMNFNECGFDLICKVDFYLLLILCYCSAATFYHYFDVGWSSGLFECNFIFISLPLLNFIQDYLLYSAIYQTNSVAFTLFFFNSSSSFCTVNMEFNFHWSSLTKVSPLNN